MIWRFPLLLIQMYMSFSESEYYSNYVHINVTSCIQDRFFLNLAGKAPRSTGDGPHITGSSSIPCAKVLKACTWRHLRFSHESQSARDEL